MVFSGMMTRLRRLVHSDFLARSSSVVRSCLMTSLAPYGTLNLSGPFPPKGALTIVDSFVLIGAL